MLGHAPDPTLSAASPRPRRPGCSDAAPAARRTHPTSLRPSARAAARLGPSRRPGPAWLDHALGRARPASRPRSLCRSWAHEAAETAAALAALGAVPRPALRDVEPAWKLFILTYLRPAASVLKIAELLMHLRHSQDADIAFSATTIGCGGGRVRPARHVGSAWRAARRARAAGRPAPGAARSRLARSVAGGALPVL